MKESKGPAGRVVDGMPADAGTRKKAYTKPAFRFERVFETMALTCGKIATTQAQCRTNRKNS